MSYPLCVQIETIARCNSHCWFCPQKNVKRDREVMTDDLLESVIQQLKQFPNPINVCPFLNNEPFMDLRMQSIINTLHHYTPHEITLFTNGSLLSGRIGKVLKYRRVNIFLSIHTFNEEEYKMITGLYLGDTVSRIKSFLKEYQKPVSFVSVGDHPGFKDGVKKTFGQDYAVVNAGISNWAGTMNETTQAEPGTDEVCGRTHHLCVFSDGRLPLCCLDYNGQVILGDANTTPLLEIYNSDLMRKYQKTKKSDIAPCNVCNA